MGVRPRDRQPERTRSAGRATSASGCAYRFAKRIVEAGYTCDASNTNALSKTLVRWHRDGTSVEDIRAMVDIFTSTPTRYMNGDEIPWRAFINAREKLRADAAKHAAPATVYDNPYKAVSR